MAVSWLRHGCVTRHVVASRVMWLRHASCGCVTRHVVASRHTAHARRARTTRASRALHMMRDTHGSRARPQPPEYRGLLEHGTASAVPIITAC